MRPLFLFVEENDKGREELEEEEEEEGLEEGLEEDRLDEEVEGGYLCVFEFSDGMKTMFFSRETSEEDSSGKIANACEEFEGWDSEIGCNDASSSSKSLFVRGCGMPLVIAKIREAVALGGVW